MINPSPVAMRIVCCFINITLLTNAYGSMASTQGQAPTPEAASLVTATTQSPLMPQGASPISPAEIKRQKRMWCAEKTQQLTQLGDRLRVLINSFDSVVKNSKIVRSSETRQKIGEWLLGIMEHIFSATEKLRSKQIPSVAMLKETAASFALHIDLLYDALQVKVPEAMLELSAIKKPQIKSKLQEASTYVESNFLQELTQQRAGLSPEQQKMIPDKLEAEFVDILMVEQFIAAMDQGLNNVADAIQDYGITALNRAARSIDWVMKRATHNHFTPYLVLPLALSGASLIVSLLLHFPSSHGAFPMLGDIFHGAASAAISQLGGSWFMRGWEVVKNNANELKSRWAIWWKRCQGLPVKEKINGFDIIKPEDCEGPDEPLIGLEAAFNRVMESIESTLNRIQAGEREPLKGVQRTFLFVAPAGTGKTFLMEQVKRHIARLNQFGVDLAFENLQGERVMFGDIMARIKEAQQNNVGLILWIDEMHLYKPMKDSNTPLLAQLLQTEEVNKSNLPIWIFTATNEPGRFDNALVRAGRFEIINIFPPSFKDRMRLFKHYLGQQGMVLSETDLRLFAAQTAGATPAMIRKVINSARASGKALTKDIIQSEIFKTVFNLKPGIDALSAREQRETAIYQSGRLLVHVLNTLEAYPEAHKEFMQGDRFALATVSAVEIKPDELPAWIVGEKAINPNLARGARRAFGKFFTYTGREKDTLGSNLTRKEKQLMVSELLAGACAQQEFLGDVLDDAAYREDCKLAFEYCREIACDGIPCEALATMSKDLQERYSAKALELYTQARHRAQTVIQQHKQLCKTMFEFMGQGQEYAHISARELLILLNNNNKEQTNSVTLTPEQPAPATAAAA